MAGVQITQERLSRIEGLRSALNGPVLKRVVAAVNQGWQTLCPQALSAAPFRAATLSRTNPGQE